MDTDLTLFISTWAWFILAVIMVNQALFYFVVRRPEFMTAYIVAFAICLGLSFHRRYLLNKNNE